MKHQQRQILRQDQTNKQTKNKQKTTTIKEQQNISPKTRKVKDRQTNQLNVD